MDLKKGLTIWFSIVTSVVFRRVKHNRKKDMRFELKMLILGQQEFETPAFVCPTKNLIWNDEDDAKP